MDGDLEKRVIDPCIEPFRLEPSESNKFLRTRAERPETEVNSMSLTNDPACTSFRPVKHLVSNS